MIFRLRIPSSYHVQDEILVLDENRFLVHKRMRDYELFVSYQNIWSRLNSLLFFSFLFFFNMHELILKLN